MLNVLQSFENFDQFVKMLNFELIVLPSELDNEVIFEVEVVEIRDHLLLY